jgi:hypothetical protein
VKWWEVFAMAEERKIGKVNVIDAGKAVARTSTEVKQLREGEKPSAPANLVLPKPVKVPLAPTAAGKSEKK